MKYIRKIGFMLIVSAGPVYVFSQVKDNGLVVNFNEDGSRYLRATFMGQVWMRYNESNPGTTVNGFDKPETFDIGLRRTRIQLFGKIHDRIFVYSQFGINNFGYNSPRRPSMFFHDVVAEYYVTPRSLQIGAGLTAWSGFARYSSAGTASILALDLPLYQQTTNDANDQFLRKLSVYAKGKIGKLDYRFVVTDPMLVDATVTTVNPINVVSDFSYAPPKIQTAGYFMYQFLDEESNLTPYTKGTYLGEKNVFNIGAGFQYQDKAMWHYGDAVVKDTIYQAMNNIAVDVFYDHRIGTKGAALTTYAAVSRTDYGKNYIRNNGAMNPGSGGSSFNGGGNAYPTCGTGHTVFAQAGYLLPDLMPSKFGKLQPYGEFTFARYDGLNEPVKVWGAGANWLIEGQKAKLTLGYTNRPVFDKTSLLQNDRRSMLILQFQVAI